MKSKNKSLPSKGNSCYKGPTVILVQQRMGSGSGAGMEMTRGEVVQDEIIEMVTSQITPGFADQRKEKFGFYSKCVGNCLFLGLCVCFSLKNFYLAALSLSCSIRIFLM